MVKDTLSSLVYHDSSQQLDMSIKRIFDKSNLDQELFTQRQNKEIDESTANRYNFSYELPRSFLPEMIRLSSVLKIPLVFVRMKRRRDCLRHGEDPALAGYIRQLRLYLRSFDIPLMDFSQAPLIHANDFADGDHLNRRTGRPLFTKLLLAALHDERPVMKNLSKGPRMPLDRLRAGEL